MGKMFGLALGGVIVIGGLWWFLGQEDNSPEMMEKENVPNQEVLVEKEGAMAPKENPVQDNTMMPDKKLTESGDAMMAKGTYAQYGPGVLEENKENKRVLFFFASWCPLCKPADAEFREKMSEIPAGVTVIRVNYNDPETDQAEKDLAAKYGVTYQHTFVQINENGEAITKWNGGKLAELLKNIK